MSGSFLFARQILRLGTTATNIRMANGGANWVIIVVGDGHSPAAHLFDQWDSCPREITVAGISIWSPKSQAVNIVGLVDHTSSVVPTHLCHHPIEAAIGNW